MPENPLVTLTIIGGLLIAIGIVLVLLAENRKPKIKREVVGRHRGDGSWLLHKDDMVFDAVMEARNDFQGSPQDG